MTKRLEESEVDTHRDSFNMTNNTSRLKILYYLPEDIVLDGGGMEADETKGTRVSVTNRSQYI